MVEVLKDEYQRKTCSRKALACVRAISALLFRRKFEKDFLAKNSSLYLPVEKVLLDLKSIAETSHKENIIDSTLSFLRTKATESDANLMYIGDNADDDADGSDDES